MKSNKFITVFLRITSILILFASFVRFFFGFTLINVYAKLMNTRSIPKEQLPMYWITFLMITVSAFSELAGGFSGAINCEEPLFSRKILIHGIVVFLLCLTGVLFQSFTGYGVSLVVWISAVAVPALFLAAAGINYRHYAQTKKK